MRVVSLTKLGLDTVRNSPPSDSYEMKVLKFLESSPHYRSTDEEIDQKVPHAKLALEKLMSNNLVVYL